MTTDRRSTAELKCENFMALAATNLYLMDGKRNIPFLRLQAPSVVERVILSSLKKQTQAIARLCREEPEKPAVLLWVDPFRLGYVSLAISREGPAPLIVTYGPVITERLSVEQLRYIGFKMKRSSDECQLLETFLAILPALSVPSLERIADVLYAYFSETADPYTITLEDHPVETAVNDPPPDETLNQQSFVAENYAMEARMLSAVEHGDVEFMRAQFPPNTRLLIYPARYPSDPLRELKNLAITGNSIMLRAAIKGGLKSDIAHNMSHTFAIRIEQQTSTSSLNELLREITLQYTEAVRKYALQHCSELVYNAVILVHRNIASAISLADIAEQLHISREHLSRRFRQEMGITLTDYIHQTKIHESLPLLASRKFDVGRVAFLFGYASPAHYTKMFTRIQGVSPHRWQQEHT